MKWALLAVLTLGALGAWAMGLQAAGALSSEVKSLPLPKVVMRPLPPLQGGPAIAVAAPAKPEPVAAKPEAAPTPEPVAAKPEAAPKPEPVAAPQPKPEASKPVAMAQPKPQPKPPPSDDAPAPAAKPAPALKPLPDDSAPPAAAPQGEGIINLKASDTAEVVIDGRKVGPSPKLGVKLKAGKHKVRFDCYDENGNLKPGKVQTVEIKPDEESDIDYECPFTQ